MAEQQREAFKALEQIEAVAGWTTTEEIERLTAIVRAALSHAEGEAVELDRYDVGLLGDWGGGNVEWWQDYIRNALAEAHDFYQQQVDGLAHPAPQAGRAYTPHQQPDNETAARLGGAGAAFAAGCGGDDYEELGFYLLRTLAEEGFGVSDLGAHPAPQVASPIDDESLARQIGEVGNQVRNLGCEQQNNEALSDRLAELANDLWKLAKFAPKTAPQVAVPDRVLMPRTLTAENRAKAELMGEFAFPVTMTCPECHPDDPNPDCEVCGGSVEYDELHVVPWNTIKRIYTAAVDLLSAPAPDEREIAVIRQLSEIARNSDYEVEVVHDDYVDITRFETDIAEHIADWLDKQADARLRVGKEGEL